MLRLLFAVAALTVTASGVFAGPENNKGQDQAERQQARDHSNEVHRMKQREQDSAWERRNQAEKDKAKVKEHAEEEEGFGHDLDDDEVDDSE